MSKLSLSLLVLLQSLSIFQAATVPVLDSQSNCFENNAYICGSGCPCGMSGAMLYIYTAMSASATLMSLFLIIGFITFPELRNNTGIILLGIAVSYLFLMIVYLQAAIFSLIWPDYSFDNTFGGSDLCHALDGFHTYFLPAVYLYNFMFCLHLIGTIRTSLKAKRIDTIFHILAILIPTAYLIARILKFANDSNLSIVGTCGGATFKSFSGGIAELAFSPLEMVLSLITGYYLKKNLPTCDKISAAMKDLLSYYYKYFIALAVISFLETLTIYIPFLFFDNDSMSTQVLISMLLYQKYIGTILKMVSCITITAFRFRDPFIKKYMIKLLYKMIFCGFKNPQNESTLNASIELDHREGRLDSLGGNLNIEALTTSKDDRINWLEKLKHNIKVQVIYTLISGIIYFNNSRGDNYSEFDMKLKASQEQNYNNLAKQAFTYRINDDVLNANMPTAHEELREQKYTIVEGSLTIYAPKIFKEWLSNDQEIVNIENSLDLKKNYSRIQRAGKATGGKSGEFFFFSSDNRLIIKTITNEEVQVLIRKLPQFAKYFNENTDTLIAKIYGVFTFERKDVKEKFNLIVMRNINGYPSAYVDRRYDMKGSTFDREALKNRNLTIKDLKHEGTLKDQDFLKYEKQIFMNNEMVHKLRAVLEKDANFLRSCGLIDYSLALYVINKSEFTKNMLESKIRITDHNINFNLVEISNPIIGSVSDVDSDSSSSDSGLSSIESFFDPSMKNPLFSIRSTKEEVYYHMGIIDYLQLYTFGKRMERFTKMIVKMKFDLDTSAQNPNVYADRFIRFCRSIMSASREV